MNASVSASGMKVQATTDGSLYINKADSQPTYDNIIASSVSWSDAAVAVRPTSTIDVTNWYYASAELADSYQKNASDFVAVSAGTESNYFLKKTVWIRSEKDFDSLVVNRITITPTYGTGASSEVLDDSLTVAFKVHHLTLPSASNTPVTDAPVFASNEDPTSNRHGGVTSTGLQSLTFYNASEFSTTSHAIWTKPSASTLNVTNAVFQVDIYIYFDGQSTNCYSNALLNAVSLEANVDVSFAAQ